MRRIESMEDRMNGVCTYELGSGQRLRLDARYVTEYGIAECMRQMGLDDQLPTERLPVMFHGRRVGTMAPDFDPDNIKSRSFLYEPRHGDFKREGDTWVAARNLGPGDIEAVPGFVRDTADL